MFGVGGDAADAAGRKGAAGGFQVGDALVEAVDNDGFEGVELELPASAAMVMVTSLPITS